MITLSIIPIAGLLVNFLYLVLALALIWGVLYCIESWISPIAPPIKAVLAIVILIVVVIWVLRLFGVA